MTQKSLTDEVNIFPRKISLGRFSPLDDFVKASSRLCLLTQQEIQRDHLFDCIEDSSLSGFLPVQFSGTGFATATHSTAGLSRSTATDPAGVKGPVSITSQADMVPCIRYHQTQRARGTGENPITVRAPSSIHSKNSPQLRDLAAPVQKNKGEGKGVPARFYSARRSRL